MLYSDCRVCPAVADSATFGQPAAADPDGTQQRARELPGRRRPAELYNASGQNGAQVTQDSFNGSIVAGKATGNSLDLSLDDAIQRGLRQNLGLILQTAAQKNANGQRLEELQALLPTVTGAASIEVQQINLAAFGLKFPGLNPIVGPFQVVDFRAYLTQNLFNVSALQNYIAAKHNFDGAKLTAEDARDLVVLTVGNAYLLCIADAARIEAVNAELATSKVSLDQAVAAHDAGTSPRLDVLRAQVDYQNEQQSLISTKNNLEKDKLALARTIGLPLDQEFRLTDLVPFAAFDNVDPQAAFEQALKTRKDLAAYAEQVKSAEAREDLRLGLPASRGQLRRRLRRHRHHPRPLPRQLLRHRADQRSRSPDRQDQGQNKSPTRSTSRPKRKLADQIQQVNQDVRDSLLDIQSAAKLVDATHSNVELANEALSEAQQRFHAGVADNLPVSQAQSQTEQANDQYISALYQHNVAKLSLARALGAAQTNYKDYLGGK